MHLRNAPRWQTPLLLLLVGACGGTAAWRAVEEGNAAYTRGDYEQALSAYDRAATLAPDTPAIAYDRGNALHGLRRYDEAVAALKKNTELQPMSPYGWYQLARVHVDRHEPEEALKVIRHLQGFEPKVAAQLQRETGLVVNRAG